VSDGTNAGSQLVKEIVPGAEGSDPSELTALGSNLVFVVESPQTGPQLWRSDGTETGTYPLVDFPIQSFDGHWEAPQYDYLIQTGTLVYCAVSQPDDGLQLWLTDGTLEGTRSFGELHPEAASFEENLSGNSAYLRDSELYFMSGNQLWKTSESPESAQMISELPFGVVRFVVGPEGVFLYQSNRFLFLPNEANELILLEEYPEWGVYRQYGPSLSGNRAIIVWADSDSDANLLVVTDGTPNGPNQLFPTPYYLDPFVSLDDRMLMRGNPAATGPTDSLWVTDGTVEGTFSLADQLSGPLSYLRIGDRLLMNLGGLSQKYWLTDGTQEGTVPMPQQGSTVSSSPTLITPGASGEIYFSATSSPHGRELWASDGTEEGTQLLADIFPGPQSSLPENFTRQGSRLCFTAVTEAHGRELWTSDGTEAGTALVADLNPGPESSSFSFLATTNSWIYAVTTDGDDTKVWRTDGTQAGTSCLASFPTSPETEPYSFRSTENGIAFFTRHTGNTELWLANDDSDAITMLNFGWSLSAFDPNLIEHDGQLFFRQAVQGTTFPKVLWTTDGTPEGTRVLLDDLDLNFIERIPGTSDLLLYGGPFPGDSFWRFNPTDESLISLGDTSVRRFFGDPTMIHGYRDFH
jgi:ELWxxDGT repeat protein